MVDQNNPIYLMGQPIEHITQSNVFSVTYYLELDNAIIVLWVQT